MLLCAASLALLPAASLVAAPLEYAVKAAYLTKFGIYVAWPDATFSAPDSAIQLCIAGDDPFGAALDKTAASQRIGERPIAVRRLKTVTRDAGCHILYIGGADPAFVQQTAEAIRGSAVLTVTDAMPGEAAGIINFVIRDDRVRFEVDEAAAAQSDLVLSSKLLSLALNVKTKR